MRFSFLKAGIIAASLYIPICSSAQSSTDYAGSYTISFSPVTLNPFETGFGLRGEYRALSRVGVLLGLDYITLGTDEQSAQSANGLRIYPELRFYLPTPGANPRPAVEMYLGLALVFKHVHTQFSEWGSLQTANGLYYQQLFEYNAINNAFAPILKLGFQFMVGSKRNLVFGLEMGVGPSFNSVKITNPPPGKPYFRPKDFLITGEEFSYNKYSGIYPEAIFGFHIGYHFGGK